MSKDMCGYCGKANGWHVFGCPVFSKWIGHNYSEWHPGGKLITVMKDPDEPDVLKGISMPTLKTLPEVE